MSELDILKLIFESDQAIFDRLSQVITAASSGGGSDVEAGQAILSDGIDTVTVVFPVPFASAPIVLVTIAKPNAGSPLIDANVDRINVTATGFTASLGAAPVGNDYRLNWMAQIATP